MYSKVYFHKTTRAAQVMLQELLVEVLTEPTTRDHLPINDPVRRYFEAAPTPTLSQYLALDDFALWNSVTFIASAGLGKPSELARRILDRDLYKCFEPPHSPDETINYLKVNEFSARLKSEGINFVRDKIPEKGYKEYMGEGIVHLKNILVDNERDGKPAPISSMSSLVKQIADPPAIRFYFETNAAKQAAVKLWQ